MIRINLLNPTLPAQPSPVTAAWSALRTNLISAGPHFDAGTFLEDAHSLQGLLDLQGHPTRRLAGAISLFEDLAADRMLRPETALAAMDQARSMPRPGIVPGFEQFRPIGFGGYGVVYWALRETDDSSGTTADRQVAIKIGKLTPQGASSDSIKRAYTIERLQEVYRREFNFLKGLDSDRIVRVFSSGLTDRRKPFIVMEYLGGGTLMHFMRQMHNREIDFSWATLYPIFEQIIEAVAYLHGKGIIHNDIKPENFLMGRDDQVKLTDFSFVTTVEEAAKRGTRNYRGTPGHISIQTAESPLKDVYALGSTMYQILTGRTPVKQDSGNLGALAALIHGIKPPSQKRPDLNIPPELDRFILRAMSPRAEAQFKDAREMLASFRRLKPVLLRSSGTQRTAKPRASMPRLPRRRISSS